MVASPLLSVSWPEQDDESCCAETAWPAASGEAQRSSQRLTRAGTAATSATRKAAVPRFRRIRLAGYIRGHKRSWNIPPHEGRIEARLFPDLATGVEKIWGNILPPCIM